MQNEREQEVLTNRSRMLNNSLQDLIQQEYITGASVSRHRGTHPDSRIPKYEAEISRLQELLPKSK